MAGCCSEGITIVKCLAYGQALLTEVTDRPRLEAAILLAHILQESRAFLIAHPEYHLTESETQQYEAGLALRSENTPLPYITGHCEFFGLDFLVTPDVLIPRPETELLVDMALEWISRRGSPGPLRIVDVCTGSGCIAISLGGAVEHTQIWATDLSPGALWVAQENAVRHQQALYFVEADLLTPFKKAFDLIISNPPYVTDEEWELLPPSVQREPRMALSSGKEGLDAIKRLLVQARDRLNVDGCLLMEFGEKQGNAVQALAQTTFPHAAMLDIIPDLAGKDRVLRIVT